MTHVYNIHHNPIKTKIEREHSTNIITITMKIRQQEFLNQIRIKTKWYSLFVGENEMMFWQNFTYISLGNVSGLDDLPLLQCDDDPAERSVTHW